MSWHRDREDSATEADRERAGKRPRSAQSPLGTAPDLSLAPASNRALTRLLQPGRLPASPSALAPAGNAAVARLMRTATVQRAELPAQDAGPLHPQIATAIDAERGGGAPLPDGIRSEMEGHLGVDLSPVRVHTGPRADTLNRAVNAQAFTTGTDVFFSSGKYDPSSSSGRELLAHELTHVARPAVATGDAGARVSHPDDAAEVEARDVAQRVKRSAPGAEPVRESGAGTIARRPATGLVARAGDPPMPPPAPPRQEPGLWEILADPNVRKTIEGQTIVALPTAAKNFTAACEAHVSALKALAKARAEAMAMFVDIFMGFLAPGLTGMVVNTALGPKLDRLLAQVSITKTVAGAEKKVQLLGGGSDFIKTAFASGTKLANDQLKKNAPTLFGEIAEEQFLDKLVTEFDKGVVYLGGQLHQMTPSELVSVWAAYDPEVASKEAYKTILQGILKQFRQVQDIQHYKYEGNFVSHSRSIRAYYVVAGGKRALGIVDESGLPFLAGWVTEPGLAKVAIQKTMETFGEVKEIAGDKVGVKTIP